ncbi:FAD-binding oxidoreductase, partial [Candidatus Parcubacteria bacterium]
MDIAQEIRGIVRGEVTSREEDLQHYSRDASLFRVTPSLVVFPRDAADIKALVHFVAAHKRRMPSLSLTARAAGTDMTGGPLSDSIVVDTTKYLHHLKELNAEKKYVVVEPGLPYREMERETLKHHLIFPSYPASKNLCALGGIVNNNSGGERSLVYGKTEDYVESVNMVLADGNEYQFAKLSRRELEKKMRQQNFEGKVYREMFQLVEEHYEEVKRARPNVSKNSTGYNIWSVWDGEHFDLSKIFVGAQGTLGIMTEARLRLVPTRPYRGMLVVFLNDFRNVGEVVTAVLPHKPAAFESFDDHTLRLALK